MTLQTLRRQKDKIMQKKSQRQWTVFVTERSVISAGAMDQMDTSDSFCNNEGEDTKCYRKIN